MIRVCFMLDVIDGVFANTLCYMSEASSNGIVTL